MSHVFASITMSLDGFIAGVNDTPEQPLGENGEHLHDWTEEVQKLKVPTQTIAGDSDSVILQHVLDMFVQIGGDIDGMTHGMPNVELAVLPGTTHVTVIMKTNLLLPMISDFLAGAEDSTSKDFKVE